jgi:hypothetical protein
MRARPLLVLIGHPAQSSNRIKPAAQIMRLRDYDSCDTNRPGLSESRAVIINLGSAEIAGNGFAARGAGGSACARIMNLARVRGVVT